VVFLRSMRIKLPVYEPDEWRSAVGLVAEAFNDSRLCPSTSFLSVCGRKLGALYFKYLYNPCTSFQC
jgi:hypothetical protein